MIYDVGHWFDDLPIHNELTHYLGQDHTIDLLIVGHSDSDHLGAADTILESWNVRKSVRTGWERVSTVGTYWRFREELEISVNQKGTEDSVIGSGDPALGETWTLGDASITFLSGFSELPGGWDVGVPSSHSKFESKARNAVSIVIRVEYDGRSILFPGDAVGKKDKDTDGLTIGTEKFLFDNRGARPIDADILLAPHHGADNASSAQFIDAVSPEWVIFSAGTKHKHPKFKTFKRYEDAGISVTQILRTDRGDKKGRVTEWWGDWDDSCTDGHGDDGISILIREAGDITVDQDPVDDLTLGC